MKMMIVFTVLFLAAMILPDVDAGFGCPNDYSCSNHCRDSIGCRGGYCKYHVICTCYGCKKRRSIQE
uniref:Defensin n=1 Tax=Ruditapes philippinarum TaxID=129788 RepID=A0A0S2IL36_RUDPH|nr:defensin [Ruditapes philippinarum]APY18891.1 defensin [Ruditapes philippinarum]